MKYDLIIIDLLNMCHRYNYSLNLTDSKGRRTGMFYGILSWIMSQKNKYKDAEIIFVHDSPRLKKKNINSDYKADRIKKSNDFYAMVDTLREMLSLYNVTQYRNFGYEADDLAARIVKENLDKKILLVSNDSDWYVFVIKDNINIYRNKKIYTPKDILEEIPTNKIKEYKYFLSITGTHNNVKGISRIRKKEVCQLIKGAENLDDLFKHRDLESTNHPNKKLLQKTHNQIIENEELICRNYMCVMPIVNGYKLKEIEKKKDLKKLINLLREYDMEKLVERIKSDEDLKQF